MTTKSVIAALIFATAAVAPAAEPDYDKLKKEWAAKVKEVAEKREKRLKETLNKKIEEDTATVEKWEAEIDSLNKTAGKTKAQIAKDKSAAASLQTKADAFRKRIAANKDAKEKASAEDYGLDPKEMKEGDFGKLGTNQSTLTPPVFKILQIQDKQNALLTWGPDTFWVEMETKGLVDGDELKMTDFVHCLGIKSYQSKGGKKTVRHLKIVK